MARVEKTRFYNPEITNQLLSLIIQLGTFHSKIFKKKFGIHAIDSTLFITNILIFFALPNISPKSRIQINHDIQVNKVFSNSTNWNFQGQVYCWGERNLK